MTSGINEDSTCDPEVDSNTDDMEDDAQGTGDHEHDDDPD